MKTEYLVAAVGIVCAFFFIKTSAKIIKTLLAIGVIAAIVVYILPQFI